jgi:MoxR-like ATPase
MDVQAFAARLATLHTRLKPFYEEVERVLVGQRRLIDRLLIGLLAGGHILVEGVPGLAKTLAVRTVAAALSLDFRRIQFTPDLLPADIIGTQIYHPRTGDFSIKKGPLFANLILADEINRAPAKVQSALLEAMQERQVTIGDQTFPLPEFFMVLATQNPIEQEGTYPLPEAQIDRFMMKVKLDYPSGDEELLILQRMAHVAPPPHPAPVLNSELLRELRQALEELYLDEKVQRYIVELVRATRGDGPNGGLKRHVQYGVSPRGSIALALAAKAQALLQGRGYVTPQDVKDVGPDVLRHRIILSYEAEAEEKTADDLLRQVFDGMRVP